MHVGREEYWRHYFMRNPQIESFPREILRKRMPISSMKEFSAIVSGYDGKTDVFTSLFSDWQRKNNIFDCVFFDIDCYVEVGENINDLNRMIKVVETFLFEEEVWFRRFFTGKKGVHYYMAFPPFHFLYFDNAVRKWAEKMPKIERVNMQKYWYTGEIERIKTWPFDPRAVGKARQLVRVPYTIHPKTGLKCVECYGPVTLSMKERHENWLPEMNENLLTKLRVRDRAPEVVDRSGGIIDLDFANSPACIIKAIRRMKGHLTHDQAWHLANYMITLGADDEEILKCFMLDPRYDECLARPQLESVRRAGLANMGCDKISFIGLCDEKQKLNCPMYPSIDRYLFDTDGAT